MLYHSGRTDHPGSGLPGPSQTICARRSPGVLTWTSRLAASLSSGYGDTARRGRIIPQGAAEEPNQREPRVPSFITVGGVLSSISAPVCNPLTGLKGFGSQLALGIRAMIIAPNFVPLGTQGKNASVAASPHAALEPRR